MHKGTGRLAVLEVMLRDTTLARLVAEFSTLKPGHKARFCLEDQDVLRNGWNHSKTNHAGLHYAAYINPIWYHIEF